jgi:hypothetical protein
MARMSPPVFVMSPLLSHDSAKGTRAAHLSKMVPITWCFFHYMAPLPESVKAEIEKGGSEKRDYRNLLHNSIFSFLATKDSPGETSLMHIMG